MGARTFEELYAVGGTIAAGVSADAGAVAGEDDADLLVGAGLNLLGVAERGEEALVVGQAEQVNLLGCFSSWESVDPAAVAVACWELVWLSRR